MCRLKAVLSMITACCVLFFLPTITSAVDTTTEATLLKRSVYFDENARLRADVYYGITLSDQVIADMYNGAVTTMTASIRLLKKQSLWRNSVVAEHTITTRLHFQPLSGTFLLLSDKGKRFASFAEINEAISMLGTLVDIPIVHTDHLNPAATYVVDIRADIGINYGNVSAKESKIVFRGNWQRID